MLEVTRADTGDRFAMKAIRKHGSPSGSANAKVVQQAQLERRILSRISHPFIIDLHCAFQAPHPNPIPNPNHNPNPNPNANPNPNPNPNSNPNPKPNPKPNPNPNHSPNADPG